MIICMVPIQVPRFMKFSDSQKKKKKSSNLKKKSENGNMAWKMTKYSEKCTCWQYICILYTLLR